MNFDCCKNCRRGGGGYEEKRAIVMTMHNGKIEAKPAAVPEVAKLLPLPASLVSITTSTSLCSRCCRYQSLTPITSIPSDYGTFLQQVFIFFIKYLVKVPSILNCLVYSREMGQQSGHKL